MSHNLAQYKENKSIAYISVSYEHWMHLAATTCDYQCRHPNQIDSAWTSFVAAELAQRTSLLSGTTVCLQFQAHFAATAFETLGCWSCAYSVQSTHYTWSGAEISSNGRGKVEKELHASVRTIRVNGFDENSKRGKSGRIE